MGRTPAPMGTGRGRSQGGRVGLTAWSSLWVGSVLECLQALSAAPNQKGLATSEVPAVGIEPTRCYPQRILSPRCLPHIWHWRYDGVALEFIAGKIVTPSSVQSHIEAALGSRGQRCCQIVAKLLPTRPPDNPSVVAPATRCGRRRRKVAMESAELQTGQHHRGQVGRDVGGRLMTGQAAGANHHCPGRTRSALTRLLELQGARRSYRWDPWHKALQSMFAGL